MSADGSKLVAATIGGGIYTSTNFGNTWISSSAPLINWFGVASSADGTRMAAAASTLGGSEGGIYTSTDGGATWNPSAVASLNWVSLACSADGGILAATTGSGDAVYLSRDFGSSWRTNFFPTPVLDRYSVGLSASGNQLAAGSDGGTILVSTNLGANWSVSKYFTPGFRSIAVSADGATLASIWASTNVYISTNGGFSWTTSNIARAEPFAIAASADGTRLFIVGGGLPFSAFSTDSGMSWTTNNQPGPGWHAVASSADGNFVAAAAYGGGIWLSRTISPPRLNITPVGSLVKLSWTPPSTNFVLQQSSDLHNWTTLAASPDLNMLTLQEEVTITPANGSAFFRLATP